MHDTPAAEPPPEQETGNPGLPGFRTWRGVYLFVFLWFVFLVIALALFSRLFA